MKICPKAEKLFQSCNTYLPMYACVAQREDMKQFSFLFVKGILLLKYEKSKCDSTWKCNIYLGKNNL